jgi:hypothetical protein
MQAGTDMDTSTRGIVERLRGNEGHHYHPEREHNTGTCLDCTAADIIEHLQAEISRIPYLQGTVSDLNAACLEKDQQIKRLRVGDPKTVARTVVIDKVEYGKMVAKLDELRGLLREALEAWEGTGPAIVLDRLREALAHEPTKEP